MGPSLRGDARESLPAQTVNDLARQRPKTPAKMNQHIIDNPGDWRKGKPLVGGCPPRASRLERRPRREIAGAEIGKARRLSRTIGSRKASSRSPRAATNPSPKAPALFEKQKASRTWPIRPSRRRSQFSERTLCAPSEADIAKLQHKLRRGRGPPDWRLVGGLLTRMEKRAMESARPLRGPRF